MPTDHDGHLSVEKGQLFESFVGEVVLKYSHNMKVDYVPKDADVWGYAIIGKTPLMVECKATTKPVAKDAVAAFFGDFKLAQGGQPKIVGILMSTGGFTGGTADSAKAYYKEIKSRYPDDPFLLYEPADMIRILAEQNKLISPDQLDVLIDKAIHLSPVAHDLLITESGRFWLVEVEVGTERSFLLFDLFGNLAQSDTIRQLPLAQVEAARLGFSADILANELYREAPLLGRKNSSELEGLAARESLFTRLYADQQLHERVNSLAGSGRELACPELGACGCAELGQITLTFLERFAAAGIDVVQRPSLTDPPSDEEVATSIAAAHLAATYLCASWLHCQHCRALGTPEEFVRSAISQARVADGWVVDLPKYVAAIIAAAKAQVDSIDTGRIEGDGQDVIAAFCVHLAAGLGPLCTLYRSAVHEGIAPDHLPDLSQTPRFENSWIEEYTQTLRITVRAPTPKTHRLVKTNRNLLQEALQKVEDSLNDVGIKLPFTLVAVNAEAAGFELIECFFELESEHVLQIFMGEELYGNKDVWIRELLQNAIDAVLLRKALLGEDDYTPKITVRYNSETRQVRVTDNGVGMSLYHVRKFFSKIGRSYYRSTELAEELRQANKTFNATSRFGVGFLSVFMVAESAEIRTTSARGSGGEDSLTIYIPALMEDFYVRRSSRSEAPGTDITLNLRDRLTKPIVDLVRQFILVPSVEIVVVEDNNGAVISADSQRQAPDLRNVIDYDIVRKHRFEMVVVPVSGTGYSGSICIPIPTLGLAISERRMEQQWSGLPETRVCLTQAGIAVMEDNEFFGEHRGPGDGFHPYFRRVFALIDFQPGALKIGVSRNEFVLNEAAKQSLAADLLDKTCRALVEYIDRALKASRDASERNDYLRTVLFGAVEDGMRYYYYSNMRSPSLYDYSNSQVIGTAVAPIYATYFKLDQHSSAGSDQATLVDTVERHRHGRYFFTLVSDIEREPLFAAWINEQPRDTRVFVVRSMREASLLLIALQHLGYQGELRSVTRRVLEVAIRYEVMPSPLDVYLKAAAGLVEFGAYKPSSALLVVSSQRKGTVSKGVGLASVRFGCRDLPFVLMDHEHWLLRFLSQVADVAGRVDGLGNYLRDLCDLLVLNIALGNSSAVRREGLAAANKVLRKIYSSVEAINDCRGWKVVSDQPVMTLEELIGQERAT